MSKYHKSLKQEIRQIELDTIAIRRIRKEMEELLEMEEQLWKFVNTVVKNLFILQAYV